MDGLGHIEASEFYQDIVAVLFDRPFANPQLDSDLLIGQPFNCQPYDAQF